MHQLSLPFSRSWMEWTAEVCFLTSIPRSCRRVADVLRPLCFKAKSLSSAPPIAPTLSTLPFAVLAALIASSISLCPTRRPGGPSSTFTPQAGSPRSAMRSLTISRELPRATEEQT